jgi:hypothetical protein
MLKSSRLKNGYKRVNRRRRSSSAVGSYKKDQDILLQTDFGKHCNQDIDFQEISISQKYTRLRRKDNAQREQCHKHLEMDLAEKKEK